MNDYSAPMASPRTEGELKSLLKEAFIAGHKSRNGVMEGSSWIPKDLNEFLGSLEL